RHADGEPVERQGQPLAARLRIGFLARPAAEDRATATVPGQRRERSALGRGEDPREPIHVEVAADLLDVDADLAARRDGDERDPAAVRDVEAEETVVPQRGLAVRAVPEAERSGVAIQIAAEEAPQHAAHHHEAVAVSREPKPLGTPALAA